VAELTGLTKRVYWCRQGFYKGCLISKVIMVIRVILLLGFVVTKLTRFIMVPRFTRVYRGC
jgi:hypothetical protein